MPRTKVLDAISPLARAYEALGGTREERADNLLASISAMPFWKQERAYAALDKLADILADVCRALDSDRSAR